ncbi:uncharacterized protein V2V93DRAFT_363833 [Kockiozyma suomiensis]|uniref:uncharacterized protein n=1 Tax=Kockiozyma suomiensis TaxID=1337062 RepID=UPI003343FBB9
MSASPLLPSFKSDDVSRSPSPSPSTTSCSSSTSPSSTALPSALVIPLPEWTNSIPVSKVCQICSNSVTRIKSLLHAPTTAASRKGWSLPSKLRLAFKVFLVIYVFTLLIKLHHYGAITRERLFTLELPLSDSSADEVLSSSVLSDGYTAPHYLPLERAKADYEMNVLLVNTPNYHFEVFVPIIEAFKQIDNANVTLVSTDVGMSKWGLRNAVEHERGKLPVIDALKTPLDSIGFTPDFIFLTTCPEDMRAIGKTPLTALLSQGAHVVCIVHEAHLWDFHHVDQYATEISYMRPWIRRDQWHFAALSRHVHTFIRSNFPRFLDIEGRDYRPLLFHPVFDFDIPPNHDFNSNEPFAIIPGKFESGRRNYDRIFTEYGHLKCDINLRLLGSGSIPRIAKEMNPKIGFITNLNFFEYFEELSKGVAIIPTLGNEHYLKSQASSTVATSIIAGTPLIASQAFLNAHSQIPLDSVWVQGDDESELQVLQRVGHLPSTEWQRKKDLVVKLRNSMMAENIQRCARLLNIIGERKYGKGEATASSVTRPDVGESEKSVPTLQN